MRSLLSTKIIATLVLIMLSIGVVGFFVSPALAQFTDPVPTSGDSFDVQAGSFGGILVAYDGSLISFITRAVQYILGFLGIVVVLILIYGGYVWMTSGGDETKVEKAKLIIRNAIIGLVIILSSYAIVSMIFNTFYGGSGGTGPRPCPGCDGDPWRSGIGVGPIESVYPAPRQTDVPINTMIAVTFKEDIDATSICNDQNSDQLCAGEAMTNNIEICELLTIVDGNNVSYNCATEGNFRVADFAGSTVSQNGRTFVIKPSHYLGLEDFADRNFYVVLKNGIRALASGESIFTNWRGDQYSWSFTTNGELDLDPPEIVSTNTELNPSGIRDMSGVFPNPDDSADNYSQAAAPTPLALIIGKTANPTARVLAGATAPSGPSPATLAGTYGGNLTGTVNVRIDSTLGDLVVTWPGGATNNITNNEQVGQASFALSGSGLIINFDQVPQRGQSWTFTVAAAVDGDRLKVLDGQQVIKEYVFSRADDTSDPTAIPANAGCDAIAARIVTDLPSLFRLNSVNSCQLDTVALSVEANRYGLRLDGSTALTIGRIEGRAASEQVAVTGQPDVARNAIVQVSFNEAVNPLSIADSFTVRYDNTIALDGVAQTLAPELSNQYRTVELRSNNQCGVNACGGAVYCWPTNSTIAGNPGSFAAKATRYQVEVKAPRLPTCQAGDIAWCSDWGGTCEQTSSVGGRCGKSVSYDVTVSSPDGSACAVTGNDWCSVARGRCEASGCLRAVSKQIYYNNVAQDIADGGIVDMAGNALNGSFNSYLDSQRDNKVTGIAEGESGGQVNLGQSGRPAYNLNNSYDAVADIWYKPSTPSVTQGFGDTFSWGFYVSDKIDIRSPLVSQIQPVAGQDVINLKLPVVTTFNKIMRLATLKPGFNYGSDPISRSVRYILLNTITRGVNPVGYWINSRGKDNNGDFFPDQTEAVTDHNAFDPAVLYGPEAGSGVEDAYQNCLLPGAGPRNGGGGRCDYLDGETLSTGGCVSDIGITEHTPININNPASYNTLSCNQIIGANTCAINASVGGQNVSGCKVPYATSTESADGSWIVTGDRQDYGPTATQGCCLGICTSGL